MIMMPRQLLRSFLFVSSISMAALALPAHADQLTLTKLRAAESQDPKNGIGRIMRDVWADAIEATGGRAYSFSYGLFKIGQAQYLVSSFRSAESCRVDECTWSVQRLTPSYEVAVSGKPFNACGALNQLNVDDGKLSICETEVHLP